MSLVPTEPQTFWGRLAAKVFSSAPTPAPQAPAPPSGDVMAPVISRVTGETRVVERTPVRGPRYKLRQPGNLSYGPLGTIQNQDPILMTQSATGTYGHRYGLFDQILDTDSELQGL